MDAGAIMPLDVDRIEAGLKRYSTRRLGRRILVFRETASTSDIAWEYATRPDHDGLCVFAEYQTAGRGRRGNRWLAEAGRSLLGSFLLVGWDGPTEVLTLVAAVATAEAIGRFDVSAVSVKWPNDVWIDDRKAAGVLVETRNTPPGRCAVIGIGINCHQEPAFFQRVGLADRATSLDIHRREPIDRNVLAAALIERLDHWLSTGADAPEQVIAAWKRFSRQLGHRVVLEYDRRRFSGHCVGVDPVHGLILQLDRGGVRMFPAAHSHIIPES